MSIMDFIKKRLKYEIGKTFIKVALGLILLVIILLIIATRR